MENKSKCCMGGCGDINCKHCSEPSITESEESHNTVDGWCCACDYDIARLNEIISSQSSKIKQEMERLKKSWGKDKCGACGHQIYSNHNLTCDCLCKVYREVLDDLLITIINNTKI